MSYTYLHLQALRPMVSGSFMIFPWYEWLYMHEFRTVPELRAGLEEYFEFYNVTRRPAFSADASSWTFQYYQGLEGNIKPYYNIYSTQLEGLMSFKIGDFAVFCVYKYTAYSSIASGNQQVGVFVVNQKKSAFA